MSKVTVKTKVLIPLVPNFLRSEAGVVQVGCLSDNELLRIGEQWTKNLIENARKQRRDRAAEVRESGEVSR